jgi:hypothetical protein
MRLDAKMLDAKRLDAKSAEGLTGMTGDGMAKDQFVKDQLVPDQPKGAEEEAIASPGQPRLFRISPLIRITLLSLYVALTLPLPFLARVTAASVSPALLGLALAVGGVILFGALSERVILNDGGIQVTYPAWARLIWRRGWSLAWSEIHSLKPRSTGQGGLVYYFLTQAGDQAYLLPMRVAGFGALVAEVQARTEIDTRDVKPLAQPWMYLILLGFTLLLLLIDAWVLALVFSGKLPVEFAAV